MDAWIKRLGSDCGLLQTVAACDCTFHCSADFSIINVIHDSVDCVAIEQSVKCSSYAIFYVFCVFTSQRIVLHVRMMLCSGFQFAKYRFVSVAAAT